MKKKVNNFIKKNTTSIILTASIIFELIVTLLKPYIKHPIIFFLTLLITLFMYLISCIKNKKKIDLFYIIYVFGLLIRTIYIFYTDINTRQHDVGTIKENGHLAYIFTLLTAHKLPATNAWQFYHPPLWHIIGATWLKFTTLFIKDLETNFETLQILTLIFSSSIMITTNKICEKLKLKNKYRYLATLIMAIHPTLIIFSGSINNDCLLTAMEALVLLELIIWYQDDSWKNTIILAITTGLCVMAKFNGAIMAIPIIYIFITKFMEYLKKKKFNIKNYLTKMLTFGLISLPIGLWYQIRNTIKFHEINRIPSPGESVYIGNHSLISRLFTINLHELFNYPNIISDHNLPAFIIKSSLFGEYSYYNLKVLPIVLTILNLSLIIISLIAIIKYLYKNNNTIINTLIITILFFLMSMFIFNITYPYYCSMDFRFIAICLLPGIIVLCYFLNNLKNEQIKVIIETLCFNFIIVSIIMNILISI